MSGARRPVTPSTVTRKDVKAFINNYIELLQYDAHQKILFKDSDLQGELLQCTAPNIFHDINCLTIKYIILQICALTDSEKTMVLGTVYYNLTIEFFANNCDFSTAVAKGKRLKKLAARINAFRKKLEPARHKRLGHLDRDVASSHKSLGRASVAAWGRFWRDLREFVSILQERHLPPRERQDLTATAHLSDADQMIRAIREGSFFRAAINDHTLTLCLHEIARASRYYNA